MSGISVIVLDDRNAHPPETFRFAEVRSPIEHGRNGLLASTVEGTGNLSPPTGRQTSRARDRSGKDVSPLDLCSEFQRPQRCGTISTFEN